VQDKAVKSADASKVIDKSVLTVVAKLLQATLFVETMNHHESPTRI